MLLAVVLAVVLGLGIGGCASQDSAGKTDTPGVEVTSVVPNTAVAQGGGRGLTVEAEGQGEIAVFPQMGHSIISVSWSPDGRYVLSSSLDIKIWDTGNGRELRTLTGHSDIVWSSVWSPDGKRIASGSSDGTVRIWDAESGRELRTIPVVQKNRRIKSVAWSPDSRYIVSGFGSGYAETENRKIRIWDAESGRELRALAGHADDINSVAWSPDGRYIASGSGNRGYKRSHEFTVKIWDARSGAELQTLSDYTSDVYSVVWSPDSSRLLTRSANVVKLWDVRNSRELWTLKIATNSASWHPDGARIVISDLTNTIILDAENGKTIVARKIPNISWAFWDPAGSRLLTGYYKNVDIWNADATQKLLNLSSNTELIGSLAISPDNKLIACYYISGKPVIKIWEREKGAEPITLSGSIAHSMHSLAFSPDGRYIASSGGDGKDLSFVEIWDTKSRQKVRTLTGPRSLISSRLLWAPDGKRIILLTSDNEVIIWDADSGQELARNKDTSAPITAMLKESPDGKKVLTQYYLKQHVKIWDPYSGQELRSLSITAGILRYVHTVSWSPDSRYLLVFVGDGTDSVKDGVLEIWNAETGGKTLILAEHINIFSLGGDAIYHLRNNLSLAWSPDGKRVFCGFPDGRIRSWDSKTGRELQAIQGNTSSGYRTLISSSDGKFVIANQDSGKAIIIWDAETGKELVQFVSFTGTDSQLTAATRGLTVETAAAASSIDNEWLTITPDGYYQASPRGDRYINVRVGNTVSGIDAYRSVLYNPDVVQARLQGRPDPASKASVTIQQAASFLPPEIALQSDTATTSAATANLAVTVTDRSQPVKNIKIIVNGRLLGRDELAAISGAKGLEAGRASLTVTGNQKTLSFRLPLSLDPGANRVEVVAFNGYAENRRYLDITRNAPAGEKPPLPNLWILAVGVNRYQDSRIRSLNYCANDAREIVALFKQQEGKRYARVNSLLIADGEAQAPTAANIRKGLGFLEQAGPRDVILLFLAGHGINEGGSFHFLPGDAALRGDGKTVDTDRTIPGTEITAVLEAPGNRLVFIDACQSGGVDSDRMVRALMDTNAFVFASSRGNELSQERDEYRHGVFTYSILQQVRRGRRGGQEGLGMQQLSGDVQIEVPRITSDQQHPSAYSLGFHDFVISE
jgi:WD40 repeat protein